MLEENQILDAIAETLTFRQLTPEQWQMWKAMMRKSPQWFVVGKSGWQTDRWRAIAGPFNNPYNAQKSADQLADDGVRDGQRQLHLIYKTQVVSLTETMRMYQNNLELLVDDLVEAEASQPRATVLGSVLPANPALKTHN